MKPINKYLLVFISFCFTLFLAEAFVRIFYPHSRDHVIPGSLFDIDNYLGWKFQTGKRSNHHTRYFDVIYDINSLGYRDKPRNTFKTKMTYRILLYGDSHVFGWGVHEDKRFSNLIENQGQGLEMWNLAVPGYGLDQQILSYEIGGKSFNANEVVFFVSKATLERTRYGYIYKKYKPKFVMDLSEGLKLIHIPKRQNYTLTMLYKIIGPIYLPYFIERRITILKEVLKGPNHNSDQKNNTESVSPHELFGDFEKRMLIMARNIALERKQRITILTNLTEVIRKDMRDFCDQNEISLQEIVLDKKKHDLILGKYDHHWNIQAHKLIANQLLSQMKQR